MSRTTWSPSICGANTQNIDINEQRGALAAVIMAKQVFLYHDMHFNTVVHLSVVHCCVIAQLHLVHRLIIRGEFVGLKSDANARGF